MRCVLGGVLIGAMIIVAVGGDLLFSESEYSMPIAGAMAWAAGLLLALDVPRSRLLQVGVIGLVGLALVGVALYFDGAVDTGIIISGNARLLSMIAAVSFLRLVAAPPGVTSQLPIGWVAYVKTLAGVSVFGTVINMSSPLMIADRLSRGGRLDRFTSQSITRVFSGCSAWSPFYGGMAAVLTYVPGAQIDFLMVACFPFAVMGLGLVLAEARWRYSRQVERFKGYPLQLKNLNIPLLLAVVVVAIYGAMPEISIMSAIAAAALLVTMSVLLRRCGWREMGVQLLTHVRTGLPAMVNELLLFLVAGIIAAGLAAMVASGVVTAPQLQFGGLHAAGLLAVIIFFAGIGIHPLVVVSGGSSILLSMQPDPNLLAATFLLGWSLGTCCSPLSGTHLVFQGRYGVPSWRAAVWNWPFVGVMYGMAVPLLLAIANFLAK